MMEKQRILPALTNSLALGEDLWIVDGDPVTFLTLPFTTRMVVIRLPGDQLWIYSPIQLTDALRQHLSAMGEVCYLIAPNHLHHLFVAEWQQAYPAAKTYGTAQVRKKRQDLHFDAVLENGQVYPWSAIIPHVLLTGSPVMTECICYYPPERTLLVADFIENFSGQNFNTWQRWLAKVAGILAPSGTMPLDWRLSFMFGKSAARRHLQTLLSWQPDRLIMAHGEIIEQDASAYLRQAFRWLHPNS